MNPNILVVGKMEYGGHEHNIVEPILHQLASQGCTIQRVGGVMDFFLPKNFESQARAWLQGMPLDMSAYQAVLVTDFWFPALPIYMYQASVSKGNLPYFVSLYHGSSWLDGDFACEFKHAAQLEDYLVKVYDKVFVSAEWVLEEMPYWLQNLKNRFYVSKFPMDAYLVERKSLPYARRVIYNARWEYDKAPERFVEFAEYCKGTDIEFVSFNNADKDKLSRKAASERLVRFTGYPLTPEQLQEELRQGGYIWNFARQ